MREGAARGQRCAECGQRGAVPAAMQVPAPAPCDAGAAGALPPPYVAVVVRCPACLADPARLGEPIWCRPNTRWTHEADGPPERPGKLWRHALHLCVLGALNRSPEFGAAVLGTKLDPHSRELFMDEMIAMSHVRSTKFAAFLRSLKWGNVGGEPAAASDAAEPRLDKLELVGQHLKPDELDLLAYFCESQPVGLLNLARNRCDARCGHPLAHILAFDRCDRVDLSWNKLGNTGLHHIARSLGSAMALRSLNLTANGLGPPSGRDLAMALKSNKSLRELNLAFNSIRAEGAASLAAALTFNSTLETLNIRSNGIGTDGAIALAGALRQNHTIVRVVVVDNNIGEEGAEELAKFFRGSIGVLMECIYGPPRGKAQQAPRVRESERVESR